MLAQVRHENQAPKQPRRVFFNSDTAPVIGQGVCFDLDYATTETGQTATDAWQRRVNQVQVPDNTNNQAFAGVHHESRPAKVGGQWLYINEPGSICLVAHAGATMTINSSRITCSMGSGLSGVGDAGRFSSRGFKGRGSALVLQTKTLADGADNAFSSLDGTATGITAAGIYTITKTGIGTACGYGDSGITPTDFNVWVVGGADDASGGDATLVTAGTAAMTTPGKYPVLTAPTADTVTIDITGGAPDSIALGTDLTLYVVKSDPTVLAYLEEGPESGLCEWYSPKDATARANANMPIGGMTLVCGGYTIGADATSILIDGTRDGLRRGWYLEGALDTSALVESPTSALQANGSSALATATFETAADLLTLKWQGSVGSSTVGVWTEELKIATTLA